MGKIDLYILLLLFCIGLVACSEKDVESSDTIFIFSEDNLEFDEKGGEALVFIETNVDWNVMSVIPSWLSFEKLSNTAFKLASESNNSYEQRETKIVFSAVDKKDTLFVHQKAKDELLFIGDKVLTVSPENSKHTLMIMHSNNYKLLYINNEDNWLSLNSPTGDVIPANTTISQNLLTLNIKENNNENQRTAQLVIYCDNQSLSDTLTVIQKGRLAISAHKDGDYKIIQKATKGCVNLVVMGDGFTLQHIQNGVYEGIMKQAISYFFSIEPYTSYKEYFNVYTVFAESETNKIGDKGGVNLSSSTTKFKTAFGTGTEITCDYDLAFEYAHKVPELPENTPLTVIIVLNSNKYAGTTYLSLDGNSLALCPMSQKESPNDFEGIVHHEVGGHAFGFLADEYVYNQSSLPQSRIDEIKTWQRYGFQMNLDFTNDLSQILWKNFIGIEKYTPVNAYEGGAEYQFGVWRSEKNSCMNNNIPYFNVQSRWTIVKRIMELSSYEFSINDFIKNDSPVYPEQAIETRESTGFSPLGAPILITKNPFKWE